MNPRWPIVITYLILFAIAIPWYWFGDAATQPALRLPRKNLVSQLGVIGKKMPTTDLPPPKEFPIRQADAQPHNQMEERNEEANFEPARHRHIPEA